MRESKFRHLSASVYHQPQQHQGNQRIVWARDSKQNLQSKCEHYKQIFLLCQFILKHRITRDSRPVRLGESLPILSDQHTHDGHIHIVERPIVGQALIVGLLARFVQSLCKAATPGYQ